VRLTIINDLTGFEQLAPEWNALLQRSYTNRIFSTFEWQLTWWNVYTPGELLIVTLRDDSGHLMGIAPWFIETRQDERVLRSIGCVDVTDYVDLIIDPAHVAEVCSALASLLSEQRDRFTRINLCNIHEDSPTLKHLATALAEQGFAVEQEFQEVCPIILLPNTFDAYVEGLDKKNRHELRRKLRRSGGDGETVTWYIVDASHKLDEQLALFAALMAASQPAKAEFLSDAKNAAFMRQIGHLLYERGWLQLSFLVIEGEACASYMNFDYGDGIQVYNSGLLPAKFGHLSPGIVLLANNIEHAITQGRKTFDFLRGNEVYKYRMGAVDTTLYMLKAQ
jgi:CelD/BcsL family acetyltransferase involved in cellulose biosynthesis